MAESSMPQLYQFDRLCPKCGKEYGDHRYRGENAEPACPERHPMPVESRDDLVKRLERWRATFGEPMGNGRSNPDNDMIYLLRDVSTRIESDAKRIAELEAERNSYARIIADVVAVIPLNLTLDSSKTTGDLIAYLKKLRSSAETAERELDTANANHRDMAARLKDMGTKLEAAERALAEETERHQWRTIDSAPKDQQLLLAVYIVPSVEAQRNGSQPFWDVAIGRAYGTKLDRWSGILGTLPSHWMPKPTPPDATAIRSGKPDGKE